jgi:hypothetical protein
MLECKKCGNLFRDNCDLQRHMSRLRPCSGDQTPQFFHRDSSGGKITSSENPNSTFLNPNSTLGNPNSTFENPNSTFLNPNSTFSNENNTCHYCLHSFSTKSHKGRHEKTCKYKDDPVRLLELELDLDIVISHDSNTECRFCDKVFCRTDVLLKHNFICKDRENYKKTLLKEKERRNVMITNNTNCHNTTTTTNNNSNNTTNNNNNLILNFGQEDLSHIQTEKVIEILRDVRKEFTNDQVFLMSGTMVNSFDNYIREKPENKTLTISDSKCLYAEAKKPEGWKKVSVDRSLNQAFKTSAKHLYGMKDDINFCNEKVFASDINNEIFSEVKQFSNKGFEYRKHETDSIESYKDDLRKIKSECKINKLK